MNGKIKTKFAALFAVALMITVCVVPVVDNAGVDAAPVSSSNGEVFEGYDITLYKEGGDYSGLVYYGADPKIAGFTVKTAEDNGGNAYYYNPNTGKLLTVDQIPGYVPTKATYGFPMIQFVYSYDDADVNDVNYKVKIKKGTQEYLPLAINYPNGVTLDNDRSQGVLTIQMGTGNFTHKLGLNPQQIAGDFEVVVEATQGVTQQVIKKTVNAGPATTISGKVTDKNGSYPVAGVTISYEVDNAAGSAISDKDGNYSFNVILGKTAKITSITKATEGIGKIYSFDSYSFDFGTITKSEQASFKAKESTVKVSILDASGVTVADDEDISVTGTWYSEKDNGSSVTNDRYTIASVSSVTGEVKDGYAYLTYSEPSTKDADKDYYFIISASGGSDAVYSFDVATISTGNTSISQLINDKKGNFDATTNYIIPIYAKEKTGTISLYDKGSNPAYGANANVQLYKEVTTPAQGTTPASYTITSVDGVKGMIDTVVGKTYFTYVIPTAGTNEKYYLLAVGEDVSNKYTFGDIPQWTTATSLPTQISGKGIGDATNGSASINATEVTYKISGKVADVNLDAPGNISYSLNGSANYAPIEKDGTYGFYVKEKSVVTVNAPSGYAPASYILGTIVENEVCDFKKAPATVGSTDVEYWITVSGSADKVTFKYSINGESSESESDVDSGISKLKLDAPFGSIITVSAEIEGYEISEFDGYKATARYINVYTFEATDGKTPISGATFDILYNDGEKDVLETITCDSEGKATYSTVYSIKNYYKNGQSVTSKVSKTTLMGPDGTEYDLRTIDLKEFYLVDKANVTIMYGAVYNNDTVTSEPVGAEPIMGYVSENAYVAIGEAFSLKAPSIDNFEFVAWMVDGVVVSEKADYTLDVDGDCQVVALYSAVHYEEPAEGLSMNVLVIGIVILILGILAVAYGIISKKQ